MAVWKRWASTETQTYSVVSCTTGTYPRSGEQWHVVDMASITGAAARKACGSPSANTRDGRHTEGAGSATLGALVWGWLAGLPGYRPAEDYEAC